MPLCTWSFSLSLSLLQSGNEASGVVCSMVPYCMLLTVITCGEMIQSHEGFLTKGRTFTDVPLGTWTHSRIVHSNTIVCSSTSKQSVHQILPSISMTCDL